MDLGSRYAHHKNLPASPIGTLIVSPYKIGDEAATIMAVAAQNDYSVKLLALRLMNGHYLNSIGVIDAFQNQVLRQGRIKHVAGAQISTGEIPGSTQVGADSLTAIFSRIDTADARLPPQDRAAG